MTITHRKATAADVESLVDIAVESVSVDPLPVRISPIEPVLVPVAPIELAVTVHVALGEPPDAAGVAIVGVPVTPLRASPKFEAATPVTGSENVTFHDIDPPLTACSAPARTIELTVGRDVS